MDIAVHDFWDQCWTHLRWAGIKASIGSADIEAHRKCGVFDDFETLSSPDWDFPPKINQGGWGKKASAYISGCAPYNTNGMIRKRDKLKKTVQLARVLKSAVDSHGHHGYLCVMFGPRFFSDAESADFEALKSWHAQFCRQIGGSNATTAFHIMIDLGLQCVKPAIVLTDLFYRLGWLSEAGLSKGMSRAKVRARYRKPEVYWPLQRVALNLAAQIEPLFNENPVREIDWIMVKYAQEPEPKRGIVRNLDKDKPVEAIAREIEAGSSPPC
jgi:hypothetical protein